MHCTLNIDRFSVFPSSDFQTLTVQLARPSADWTLAFLKNGQWTLDLPFQGPISLGFFTSRVPNKLVYFFLDSISR